MIEFSELAVKKSGFWTNVEPGTRMSPTPCFCSTCLDGSLKPSAQTTSLAISRRAGTSTRAPTPLVLFVASACLRASVMPTRPL